LPAPRKLRTNADFLIVGGGLAGLSAFVEALRLDIDAICPEAHAKPGGGQSLPIRIAQKLRSRLYSVVMA